MHARALLAVVLCVLPAAAQPCKRGFSAPDRIITANRVRSAVYGDFDEDGRVDVAFESTHDLLVSLNRGDGVFELVSMLPLPVWTRDVNGVTDLDRDGHLDLLFGRPISAWVRGHGDGRFEAPLPILDNPPLTSTELVDFDHDGFLDVAVWSSSGVRFLRAAENGTFVETTSVALAGSSDTAGGGVGDFDGDGNVDVVRVIRDRFNDRSLASFVWSATTAAPTGTTIAVPFDTHGLWDVDADGDGSDDLFGVSGDELVVLHFSDRVLRHESIPFPGEPQTIPVRPFSADVDADGRRDLVFGYEYSVGFARGLEGGGFAEPMFLGAAAANEYSHADIDGDGRQDVVTTRGSDGLSVLYAGSTAFRSPAQRIFPLAFGAGSLLVADMNGDGRKDIVGVGAMAHFANVLINDGAGFFRLGSALTMDTNVGVGAAVAIGDFDGDGHLDLAAGPDREEAVNPLVAFGDGTGSFPERIELPRAVVIGSLRTSSAGRPSVLVIREGEVRALQVNRVGEVTVTSLFPIGANTSVRVFDLDGDGIDEIAVKEPSTIDILQRNGIEWTAIHRLVPNDGFPLRSVEATDINGDDVDDLLVKTTKVDAEFYLRRNNGYDPAQTIRSMSFLRDATVADVDDDGRPDLIAASFRGETAQAGMIEVHRGDGLGAFTPYNTALGSPFGSALAMDVDGDGAVDLLSTVAGGIELHRNVCVTPRLRATAVPRPVRPGNPVKLLVHALSTESLAIGTITIKQDGAVVAQKQPGGVYNATIAWTSDPLPEGQHLFTIEYNDQFAGLSSTTLTVDVRDAPPRRRSVRH